MPIELRTSAPCWTRTNNLLIKSQLSEQQYSVFEEAQCADAELTRIIAILKEGWYKFSVGNRKAIIAVVDAANS
jgi:hypothetical protein